MAGFKPQSELIWHLPENIRLSEGSPVRTHDTPLASRPAQVRQNSDPWYHSVTVPSEGDQMAIGSAIERGSQIDVFDERGRVLFSKARGSGPQDGLVGFTSATVTVRFGSSIFTFGEHGQTLFAKAA